MSYLAICLTAFLVSGLTLFSGFGLGTVLMPAFALFFPLPVAIAGASLLALFAELPPRGSYTLGGRTHEVSLLKTAIGALIVGFALLEFSPRWPFRRATSWRADCSRASSAGCRATRAPSARPSSSG